MADDCWLEKDRNWLLSVLPDATEAELDFFVEKVAERWADMGLPDEVNRALTLGEVRAAREPG